MLLAASLIESDQIASARGKAVGLPASYLTSIAGKFPWLSEGRYVARGDA